MVKRLSFIFVALMLGMGAANAQLGGLLQKAAQKAADAVTNAAAQAAASELGLKQQTHTDTAAMPEQKTYAQLMSEMPSLPSEQQLVSHKEAELNEQTLKLVVSPVTAFSTSVLRLASEVATLAAQTMDSSQLTDMAYRYAEMSTGLSREELDRLAEMSDEEQEAYLMAHYNQAAATEKVVQHVSDVSNLLEPVQPLIDRWSALSDTVDAMYEATEKQCRAIYQQYAPQIEAAVGQQRNKLLIKYYTDVVPMLRTAVQNAQQIRTQQQMPVAEQIEEQMSRIRAEHSDVAAELQNYLMLTATLFFSEVSHLLEIPGGH